MGRRAARTSSQRWLVAVVATAGAALAYASKMPSIWLDEASSIALARLPFDRLWAILSEREANMGVYYLLLKGWSALGDGLFVMQLLSIALGAAGIVCMYHLATLVFDRRVGIVAAALLAVNGMFVAFATEVRGYMLALVLVLLASYWFARCVVRTERRAFVLYALCASLAVYGHLFAGLVVLSHALSLAWLPGGERKPRPFAAAYLAILVATAPITIFALTNGGQIGWIGSTTPSDLAAAAVVVSGGLLAARARDALHYGIGALLTLLYGAASVVAIVNMRRYRDPWPVAFALTCVVLPAVLVLGVSLVAQPIWHYRYFVVVLPFAVLLVARGLQTLARPRAVVAATGLLVLSLASNLLCVDGCTREDWAGASAFVAERARSGDAALFYAPEVRTAFDYYAGGRAPAVVYPSEPWTSPAYDAAAAFPQREELADALGAHDRVWLVLSHDDIEGDAGGARLERWVEDAWGRPEETRAFEEVRVLLFGAPPAD